MSKRNANSQVFRHLAEDLVRRIAEAGDIPEWGQEDLVTSLVRQWVSYGGCASLFLGERQLYFLLKTTPLGKPFVVSESVRAGWRERLLQDWKIDPDDLPDVFEQLNRGQSA